ncbi:MAG: aldehyde dehydrogenase family protein [Candidatus Cloacimonetes bacterium]|nr:aldehyde dehydrogenase family protein [Candidatus Cloacimonadota bacterium]
MQKQYPLFIGNTKVKTKEKRTISCPHDKIPVGIVYIANDTHIDQAIKKAVKCFETSKDMPAYERSDILFSIAKDIENTKDVLAETLALECAKNITFARGEVKRAIQTFTLAAEEAKRINGDFFGLDSVPKGAHTHALVKLFPIGPVLGIAPFNFPINLVAHKVAPAIAVGNPIIMKPSSLAPISALNLAEIIIKYVPDGMLSVLPCSGPSIMSAVKNEDIKMISFTGSPAVGWKLKDQYSKKRICLELGGNAGLIIDEDADIEDAVNKSIIGGFGYAGQVCIHTQRFYVHNSIFKEFLNLFLVKTKEIKLGHPLDEEAFLNCMISEQEAIRAESWIQEAVQQGAEILCGGKRDGTKLEATILTKTKQDMKVEKNEVFAPVVTLTPFDDFKKAVGMINNSVYGLQAGVFSNNLKHIKYAFKILEVGGVIINNTPTFRVDQMPYGGVKNSGFGREGVRYSIEEMTELKLLVI